MTQISKNERLLQNKNNVLELISRSASLHEILDCIITGIECESPMLCSFLLLDREEKHLLHGAAPSLPDEYNKAIDGVSIGPNVGSCGTAAYFKKQVIVENIEKDPLWEKFADLALSFNLRACWSTPILSKENRVLGTFAMYYSYPCKPSNSDFDLIKKATHLAKIAIERNENEKQLLELNKNLENRVEQRTQELLSALEKLNKTQDKLIHSEKMASLGQLLAGVAHEINNPIGFIYGGIQNLDAGLIDFRDSLYKLIDKEEVEILGFFNEKLNNLFMYVDTIVNGSVRIKDIVNDLSCFSRFDEKDKKITSIKEGVESTLALVKSGYKNNINFICDIKNNPEIECWPGQLNQVFMNLVINSCQAISLKQRNNSEWKGSLVVSVFSQEQELIIRVQDDGCGMSEEVRKKLFDPFFSTKSIGEGMGLGLSIVFDIIKKHKGSIDIQSIENKGTSTIIYLPLA